MPWYLKWLSKKQLLKLLWRILRKVFGRIYNDAALLVVRAQMNSELDSGLARAEWVAKELVKRYNELSEWRWVVNLIIEGAVSEYRNNLGILDITSRIK